MKYDDATWHSGGNFTAESPAEYGGTHIALFLKWCFVKGWAGKLHLEHEPEDVQRVIDGELAATEFLFTYCDGKFTDENLNEEGNRFATEYYGKDGLYLEDYGEHFGDLVYTAPESEHDFMKFSSVLEKRYRSGVLTKSSRPKRRPWWKLWGKNWPYE